MKTMLWILLVFGPIQFVFAQQASIAIYTEYTVAGHQLGGSVGFESKMQWGLSAFLQSKMSMADESADQDRFYGLQFQAPLVKTKKVSFFATLRTGIVNENFFVVVPGLETRVALTKRLGIAAGMGLRMSYPSISAKLLIRIF